MASMPKHSTGMRLLVFRALGHDQPRDSHVHGAPHTRAKPTAQLMQYERGVCARRTATKYRNTTATTRHPARLGAARTCLATDIVAAAGSSGRSGRRFKSCHPDQCRRSLTCANAALRWPAFHSGPPADAPKEQKEPQGKPGPTSTGRRTPSLPARHSSPSAEQGPSGHCDPPSATKRPFRREVRRPGITADPTSASSGPSQAPPRRRIRLTIAGLNSTN